MSRPRLTPGQPLASAISARAYNRAQDAADIVLGDRPNAMPGSPPGMDLAANVVLIKNISGYDVPQFGVLGISGAEISPAQSLGRIVLNGTTPLTEVHSDRFVVLLEPCRDGDIARAAAGGCFPVRVLVTSADHKFANVKNNDRSQLQSASCGVLQMLYAGGSGTLITVGAM